MVLPGPIPAAVWRQIPRGVWALGFVSLLMDVSSEMIHALLPVYLVVGLGATALTVGIIEGVAEAMASITKVFSGALSDRLGKRKVLAAIGYGLAAFTKPVFPLASSVSWLVAARTPTMRTLMPIVCPASGCSIATVTVVSEASLTARYNN